MNIKSLLKINVMSLIALGIIITPVYAGIEIKDTSSVLTSQTVSDYYLAAKSIDDEGQALEGTNVNVHMTNNKEWATVSYFSNSAYGTGGAGGNTGVSITTNNNSHYTTNGNATGVMDWRENINIHSSSDFKLCEYNRKK